MATHYGPFLPTQNKYQQWNLLGGLQFSLHIGKSSHSTDQTIGSRNPVWTLNKHSCCPKWPKTAGLRMEVQNLNREVGLCSAPIIFSTVADALLWIMTWRDMLWTTHYVNDFLTIKQPNLDEYQHNMDLMHEICQHAGMEIRLPEDKLALALKSRLRPIMPV